MIEGDAVVHEIVLAATPDAVFDMFTDAELLVRWIGLTADLDPRPGGRFRFEVAPGQHCEGEYVVVERPTRIVITWGWTEPTMGVPPGSSRVQVDLEAVAEGTRLRLVHDRLPGDMRLLHDDGWTRFLQRLSAVAAGGEAGAYPAGDPAARRAQLEDRSGGAAP